MIVELLILNENFIIISISIRNMIEYDKCKLEYSWSERQKGIFNSYETMSLRGTRVYVNHLKFNMTRKRYKTSNSTPKTLKNFEITKKFSINPNILRHYKAQQYLKKQWELIRSLYSAKFTHTQQEPTKQ